MSNITEVSHRTQVKLHQYLNGYRHYLSLPEYKFLWDMVFGILKHKHIHLAKIARALQESISPKKTEERLSYHLGKADLSEELMVVHLERIGHQCKRYRYLIYDGSDIVKSHAEKMEGLALVRDGSQSSDEKVSLGKGYHWDNLIAVSEDGSQLLPLYSEIYSLNHDKDRQISENKKLIKMQERVSPYCGSDSILVIDRGGDRRVLIKHFLDVGQHFIIRQTGKRHLFYKGKALSLKRIAREVKLPFQYRLVRDHHGRRVEHLYEVGAVAVGFPTDDLKYSRPEPLWLVVVKEQGRGYSWFLTHQDTDIEAEVVKQTMQGYQYRWRIEEFHRQMKQDFSLEAIQYQRYEAIRSIGALLVIVMGFIASLSKEFSYLLLHEARLLPRNKWKDLPNYIYYKLTEGLRIILARVLRRRKTNSAGENKRQLVFNFY